MAVKTISKIGPGFQEVYNNFRCRFQDIDEIMLGKKSNSQSESDQSEWKECFDESSQSVYYWNTKTNECTWDPPQLSKISTNKDKSKGNSIDSQFFISLLVQLKLNVNHKLTISKNRRKS